MPIAHMSPPIESSPTLLSPPKRKQEKKGGLVHRGRERPATGFTYPDTRSAEEKVEEKTKLEKPGLKRGRNRIGNGSGNKKRKLKGLLKKMDGRNYTKRKYKS